MAGIEKLIGVQPELRRYLEVLESALAGDIVMRISPATVGAAATAAAWERDVLITLENAAGDIHTWFSGSFTTTLSIGDTSTAGTASIESTTLTFVDGKAVVTVSGDAAAWLAVETDTLTVANITVLGVTVTGGTSVETFA